MERELDVIRDLLKGDAGDALPYDPGDDIGAGVDWNTGSGTTTAGWTRKHTPVRLATTVEVPYAKARDTIVTADRCRAWGRRLADAVTRYFQLTAK
jgi:hypothetical protein